MLIRVADGSRAVTRDVGRRQLPDLDAEDAHRSGRWTVEAREDAQEGRLPGPARPEHGDDLVLADRQREALQRGGVAFARLVHAEKVADVDRSGHVPTSAKRPATSPRNARRVAMPTTTAASAA